MCSLNGKSAVVTGGCSGIGYEIVKQFLERGISNIAILDICDGKNILHFLQSTYGSQEIMFIHTDVSKKDQVDRAFKEIIRTFDYIDFVIGNAGILCETDYERTINVNLLGVLHSTYAGIEFMSKERNGRGGIIINISSVAAFGDYKNMPSYCASKQGIVGLNQCFSSENYYQKYGIKFITICPGPTKTPIIDDFEMKVMYGDLKDCKLQTATEAAQNILEITNLAENGSIWILENGKRFQITLQPYLVKSGGE